MISRYRDSVFLALVFALLGAASAHAQHLSPSEFASQLRLAEVYDQTRDLDDAIRIYEFLHKADSTNEEVFDGLVRDYFFVKRYTDVELLVKSRILDRSHDQDLMLVLARVEAKLNKKPEAMDAFSRAEKMTDGSDCAALIPVATALVDVDYNAEAIALLKRVTASDNIGCAGSSANLYLRMGKCGEATKEYLTLLQSGEGNLQFVEQRIAQFTTDSAARMLTLDALKEEMGKANPTSQALELLAWMYGEEKDYKHAFEIVLVIDSLAAESHIGNQGFGLLVFAEKARNEGALDIAVKAFDEAIKRIKSGTGKQNDYFLAQAELGALKTTEAYYTQKQNTTKEEAASLITRYEQYATNQAYGEFALDALLRAATLSYTRLFDLKRATDDYQKTITRSQSYNDRMKTAIFGLVDISLANANMQEATDRLNTIQGFVDKRKTTSGIRLEDKETFMHITYERALIDYYQTNFDSSLAKLRTIVVDSASDYANDAISLGSTISESKKAANLGSLKMFAAANLSEFQHDFAAALSAYQTIMTTWVTSPLADDAALHAANIQVALGQPADAVTTLETMQEKMPSSPILDEAAFREAEIVEQELHDKKRAEKLYEDLLARFPRSTFEDAARERARKLRGDVF